MMNFFKKFLALFNTMEGIIHLVVAAIAFWGIFAGQVWDWRVWTAPTENLIFGLFSILTGYILGTHGHNHSNKDNSDNSQ